MLQLLIAFSLIFAVGITLLLSTTGTSFWFASAEQSAHALDRSLTHIARAYDLAVRANNGALPAVTADSDGGFDVHFGDTLKLGAFTPAGYHWKYGVRGQDGSPWQGLSYVCLEPEAGDNRTTEAVYRGMQMARSGLPASQAVIGSECGSSVNVSLSSFPGQVAFTFFLKYTPGVTL